MVDILKKIDELLKDKGGLMWGAADISYSEFYPEYNRAIVIVEKFEKK